ncbi:MAG: VWA domain-containing protein, partial [Firmicutes bacterium]|nr:VWA domain-containing protein [Bacillota bacterium]
MKNSKNTNKTTAGNMTAAKEATISELVFILDKSGSMSGLEDDTIGGFNSVVEQQRAVDGTVLVSCVMFSNDSQVVYDRVPIEKIEKMTREQYRVGGCTALVDAMGDAIHHISNVHKYARPEDRPATTMFVVMTDGLENASNHRTSDEVKKMISEKRELGWDFMFLGANFDAVETAKQYGIPEMNSVRYKSDGIGTAKAFGAVGKAFFRKAQYDEAPSACWKEEIEADVRERG